MKFATVILDGHEFIGAVTPGGKEIVDLKETESYLFQDSIIPDAMLEAIQLGTTFVSRTEDLMKKVQEGAKAATYPIGAVAFKAPIPRPAKNIFCIGKNYADHAIELGSAADIPKHPIVFSKVPTTVVGHRDGVLSHKQVTEKLDYEGELAVIIGKKGKGIAPEDAMNYVFGYTIINDVTARDLQNRHIQYLLGKSLDTTCPMGPYLVYADEVANPHHLNITTKVNGEVRQSANTKQFIFDIPTIIATISQGITLEPGDIIATGTPAGVGHGMKPPCYLKAGDEIEITIEGIGTLMNRIVDEQ